MEEQELKQNLNTLTESEITANEVVQKNLESLPRLEDLLKSEKQLNTKQEIKGLTQAKTATTTQDKAFAQKKDEKQANLKRRLKTVTGVYAVVAGLLAVFAIVNVVTLAVLNKQLTTNLETIQTKQQQVENVKIEDETIADSDLNIILGTPPRDYDDDDVELSFWDKVSILFKNLFG